MSVSWWISAILILFALLTQNALSSNESHCVPYPIGIGIQNVTLGNNVARGVSLSVGTPKQPFAFLPQWPLNSTFVYGTDGYCSDSMSEAACETFRGGAYDESTSTTGSTALDSHLAETSPYPAFSWVTDDLILNDNTTLTEFPFGIARDDWGAQGYHPQAAIGLGRNSTILNTLYSAGRIASRSWAMWWGRTGASMTTQQDGSFVFGGYDRAKTTGANYTDKLNYANSKCPTGMLVTISDMVLNFANGTSASLFNDIQSSAMSACIVPDYPVLMTIPREPWFEVFETLTGQTISDRSFGIYYYGMLYENTSDAYTGDLTISLLSGFSVRIPNDQLVVPDLSIEKSSGALVANGSTPEIVVNALQQVNADDLPQLGRQFLSSAYLMLNQDANSFTLWEASQNADVDLVAVDEANRQLDQFCDVTKSDTTSSTHDVNSSDNDRSHPSNGLSAGAIAGVVVGCVVSASVIAGSAFIWMVLKRKRRIAPKSDAGYIHQSSAGMRTTGPPNELDSYDTNPGFRHELPALKRSTASSGLPELP
ncbi:acid protease [Aspergillus nidulans var. acristatus]